MSDGWGECGADVTDVQVLHVATYFTYLLCFINIFFYGYLTDEGMIDRWCEGENWDLIISEEMKEGAGWG